MEDYYPVPGGLAIRQVDCSGSNGIIRCRDAHDTTTCLDNIKRRLVIRRWLPRADEGDGPLSSRSRTTDHDSETMPERDQPPPERLAHPTSTNKRNVIAGSDRLHTCLREENQRPGALLCMADAPRASPFHTVARVMQCFDVTPMYEDSNGAGVSELIERLVSTDLADLEPRLQRHHILLGTRTDTNAEIFLKPYGVNLLLTGTSGGGKTTLATGIIERLIEQAYQVCVIDPEGDYAHLEDTIMLGSANRSPDPEEVLQLLEKPQQSVVITLLGIALEDRPAFFNRLLPHRQAVVWLHDPDCVAYTLPCVTTVGMRAVKRSQPVPQGVWQTNSLAHRGTAKCAGW